MYQHVCPFRHQEWTESVPRTDSFWQCRSCGQILSTNLPSPTSSPDPTTHSNVILFTNKQTLWVTGWSRPEKSQQDSTKNKVKISNFRTFPDGLEGLSIHVLIHSRTIVHTMYHKLSQRSLNPVMSLRIIYTIWSTFVGLINSSWEYIDLSL